MPRQPLTVQNNSRDATRLKGSWGVNVMIDERMAKKRPGFGSKVSGATPGQGLFNWTGQTVSVQQDVLHVGAGTYAL